LPTETVYGLAANALDEVAVRRIFAVKGRPAHNPIIVHVADEAMARRCASSWPEAAARLCRAFWPGPLTLVLPRAKEIPDAVTAGGATVGIRWPSHPFMLAVIRACGFPLAAPSANVSNEISPTTAGHVLKNLGGRIPLVVDGGPAQVGIESSVVDLTSSPARLLRPGIISPESLRAVVGRLATCEHAGGGVLRSPGQLPRHYAPKARLLVLLWEDEAGLRVQMTAHGLVPARTQVVAHTHIPLGGGFGGVSVIPHDAEAFARALYAELHRCDAVGAEWIVVEAVPETPEWHGIADRLRRASAAAV
jgi:L-threonylcarbamoyladenylate synthase